MESGLELSCKRGLCHDQVMNLIYAMQLYMIIVHIRLGVGRGWGLTWILRTLSGHTNT